MFVEEVMELVELTPLRDALVGLPGVNGLSTEQRKRLTIAVELVANPSIIFMDEPTSGLDARAAAIVMRTVRNTVDTGRTVVCTIHQPSIDIFDAFDEVSDYFPCTIIPILRFEGSNFYYNHLQLVLLKRGGEEIYVGELGRHSCQLIKYFQVRIGRELKYVANGGRKFKKHLFFFFLLLLSFPLSRGSMEWVKLKMDTILQLGCWK